MGSGRVYLSFSSFESKFCLKALKVIGESCTELVSALMLMWMKWYKEPNRASCDSPLTLLGGLSRG